MRTVFELKSGTCETNSSLDGWIITSDVAVAEGAEDEPLRRGDRINLNGDVYRNGECIANIS